MWDFDRHRELSKKKKKEDYFSFSDGSALDIIMIKHIHKFTSTMLFKRLFICEHSEGWSFRVETSCFVKIGLWKNTNSVVAHLLVI